METKSNRSNLIIGGLLVALGVIFLGSMLFQQILGSLDWENLWPFTVIGVGGLLFIGMLAGGRATSALAIPASIVTTVGAILWFDNTFGTWESWSYAWGLIVVAVGVGLVLHGKLSGQDGAARAGYRIIALGLVLFLTFGALMQFIFSVSGVTGGGTGVFFSLGLALLGTYLLVRRLSGALTRSDAQPYVAANLFWPVILIGLGALWALAGLRVLPGMPALVLLRLWPVLLVAVGLDLMLGRGRPWVGAVLGVLVVAGMFAFVGLGSVISLSQRLPWLYAGFSSGDFGSEEVTGSGQLVTQERSVGSFSSIDLRGRGTLDVVQGAQNSLVVEAEESLLPYIVTRVVGGELIIENKDGFNLGPTLPIRYHITVKDLHAFTLSGSGDTDLGALQTSDLTLRINGSGSIHVDELQAKTLTAKINGSGDIEVAGKVDQLDMNINGSGTIGAAALSARQVELDIPGSGEATLWAIDDLDVAISGSGSVSYYGSPQVHQSGHTDKVNALGSK